MSKPKYIYRITHQAFDVAADVQCITDILDNDNLIDDSETQTIIDLIGAGEPQVLSSIDNDEDPFTPIKAQQQILRFISSNGVGMSTFSSGSDQRWSVHSYIGNDTKTTFKGWLFLEGMSEDFMPEGNVVVLTANDGLGTLKELPLVDFDGNSPSGVSRIIDYIAWALAGTGMQLQINCAFNIKNAAAIDDISTPNVNEQHFFSLNYLDAKTFEDSIGTCVNMYQVLTNILSEEGQLFQRHGMWWIRRIDEVESADRGLYVSTYTYQGVFIENKGQIQFNKTINIDSSIFFSRERTKVVPTRPLGTLKITAPYNTPLEIPDNVDFSRGEILSDTPTEKTYIPESWTYAKAPFNPDSMPLPDSPAYIKKIYENGYEKERYIVLPSNTTAHALFSKRFHIHEKDKLDIAIDFAWSSNQGGGSIFNYSVYYVLLKGTAGNNYYLDSPDADPSTASWVATDAAWSTISPIDIEWDRNNIDERDFRNVSVNAPAAPVEGEIFIALVNSGHGGYPSVDVYFNNLSVTYIPFINGSYHKYTGQSQSVTQSGGYKAKRERPVLMSNLPKRLFKGALLEFLIYVEIYNGSVIFVAPDFFKVAGDKRALFQRYQRLSIQGTASNNQQAVVRDVEYSIIGDQTVVTIWGTTVNETVSAQILEARYQLAGNYYNAAVFPSGAPDETFEHPYSEIQVFDVWNQFNTSKGVFQATCQGLDLSLVDGDGKPDNAHFIHKWFLTDASEHTFQKVFTLLTFNQDYRTQEWNGVLREINNYGVDKQYSGREFKYES